MTEIIIGKEIRKEGSNEWTGEGLNKWEREEREKMEEVAKRREGE